FSRGPPTKEGPNIETIGTFGRGSQPEKLDRLQVVNEFPIRSRLGVMELVDANDGKRVTRDGGDAVRGQGLHASKDVFPAFGPRAADVQLAEITVAQDFAIGPERLLQNLSSMSDKEQRRLKTRLAHPSIVKCGDHGLTRAGGSDNEVAVAVVQPT